MAARPLRNCASASAWAAVDGASANAGALERESASTRSHLLCLVAIVRQSGRSRGFVRLGFESAGVAVGTVGFGLTAGVGDVGGGLAGGGAALGSVVLCAVGATVVCAVG